MVKGHEHSLSADTPPLIHPLSAFTPSLSTMTDQAKWNSNIITADPNRLNLLTEGVWGVGGQMDDHLKVSEANERSWDTVSCGYF